MIHSVDFCRLPARYAGIALVAFSLLALGGSGCATLSRKKAPDKESASEALPEMGLPKAEVADDSALELGRAGADEEEQADDEFNLPEREAGSGEAESAVDSYPDNLITDIVDPDKKVEVTVNLDAASLTDIVPLFADLLNFSYLIDPSVKGAVTMAVASEMTAREAWDLFEHILWLAGGYASRNKGFIHILPFSKMPQERRLLVKHDPRAHVEVAFVNVKYAGSQELMPNLTPFLTQGASITNIPRLNSLLIVEAPENMPKIRELVRRLDTRGEAAWPHIAVRCHSVDAEMVVNELLRVLPVLGFPVSNKSPSGGKVKLVAIPHLQVIVASAAVPEVLDEVRRWVEVLDKEDRAEEESLFFYNVRHSTVENLNDAIKTFFTNSATTRSRSTTTKSTSSKAQPSGGTPPLPSGSISKGVEIETIFDTPVVVYADASQNRLTIRTSRRTYETVLEPLLMRLDRPPPQVLIQGVLAEITLSKSTQFGFAYALQNMLANERGSLELITDTIGGDSAAVGTVVDTDGDGAADAYGPRNLSLASGIGLLFRNNNADKIGLIKAVAGDSNTRVISAPQIMASNDEQAKINVGSQIPLITSDTSDVDAGQTYNRSYNYQDTGIIMTVTPHVTAGNEVRLEISQEVSSPASETINGQVAIQKSLLETQVAVPDGGTILMGGLIKTTDSKARSGIPLLMDIPLLGRLFRSNTTNDDRREILVMITVNVVTPQTDFDALTHRYQRSLEAIREKLNTSSTASSE